MRNLFYSIIVPSFNRQYEIHELINSFIQLNFPRDRFELIIVDDGSTDNSVKLIKRMEGDILYIYQQHQGPSKARNTGLEKARGEMIAFIDADDLWPLGRLHLMVDRFQKDPSLEVVMGRTQYFGDLSRFEGKMNYDSPEKTTDTESSTAAT